MSRLLAGFVEHGRLGRKYAKLFIPAMLAHKRCPCCGYDLANNHFQHDCKLTQCPECGSEWKLSEEHKLEALVPNRVQTIAISDHRGKSKRVPCTYRYTSFIHFPMPIEPYHAKIIANHLSRTTLTLVLLTTVPSVLLGVYALILNDQANNRSQSQLTWVLLFFAIFTAMVTCVILSFLLIRHRYRSVYAKRMTEYRWCPHCGHSLMNLPRESDGCTLCPSCNAAWQLPPMALHLRPHCQSCQYDFTGLPYRNNTNTPFDCPECGWEHPQRYFQSFLS